MAKCVVGGIWPHLDLNKYPSTNRVMAGQAFTFVIVLRNTGLLAIQQLAIQDDHPGLADFCGIRYAWYERLFPGMRRIVLVDQRHFVLRGQLDPGERYEFRLRYRAHVPSKGVEPLAVPPE